jgi:hypothetical protein
MRPGTEDPWKKTRRSIRCPARIRPLENSPNRFSSLRRADGRQPFMPASVSRRLSSSLFPSVCLLRRMRPLFCRRDSGVFHQRWGIITRVPALGGFFSHRSAGSCSLKASLVKTAPAKAMGAGILENVGWASASRLRNVLHSITSIDWNGNRLDQVIGTKEAGKINAFRCCNKRFTYWTISIT